MKNDYCFAAALLAISFSCCGSMQKDGAPQEASKLPKSVIIACWAGDAEWIQAFLREGGDPNAKDSTGLTLFARACARGNTPVVQDLIDHKASLELVSEGKTPLMWASYTGKAGVVNLLIKNKVKLETQDEQGSTAFMLAAQEEELSCAESLLKAGANMKAKDKAGITARMYAQSKKHQCVIELLNIYKKKRKQMAGNKRAVEKEGYELVQSLDSAALKELEKQNAPTWLHWCAIQ